MSSDIKPAVVIKASTNLLVGRDSEFLSQLAGTVAAYRHRYHFVVVSSGAIGLAMKAEGLTVRPQGDAAKQRLASVGQPILMQRWRDAFAQAGVSSALGQMLFTHDDLARRTRAQRLGELFNESFANNTIQVINENDTVATDEISFGDNDQLAARVAMLLGAQKLMLLTHSVEGLEDAQGQVVQNLQGVSDEAYALACRRGADAASKGGMSSKLLAAAIGTASGKVAASYILGGQNLIGKLDSLLRGRDAAVLSTKVTRGSIGTTVFADILTKSLGVAQGLVPCVQVNREATFGRE